MGKTWHSWMTHEELYQEHLKLREEFNKLKTEYERTREIVDMTAAAFCDHAHMESGFGYCGLPVRMHPPKPVQTLDTKGSENAQT